MDIINTQGQDSHVVTLTRSSLGPIAGYLVYVYTLLFSIATLSRIENITVTSVNRKNNTMIHGESRQLSSLLYEYELQQNHPNEVYVACTDRRCFILVITTLLIRLPPLYYYMRNFCNLIGLEQWYFSLI